jgi:orotidine-5'-phosphate decarboxylase
MDFLQKYKELREKKDSILSIGLDPALKDFREKNFIPDEYVKDDLGESMLDFCLDMLEQVSDSAIAVKPNSQFILFAMNQKQIRKLTEEAHKRELITILDHKLSDIGSTNLSAFYWISKLGFDAVTFSPFPGNIREATEMAHKYDLALMVLTLMSNPQARKIQKNFLKNGKPLYQEIAAKAKECGADSLIIGATGHVTPENIKTIRETAGEDSVFLCPGIGAQGGDVEKLMGNAGENLLINVTRAVIYSGNPRESAKNYRDLFNRYRNKL